MTSTPVDALASGQFKALNAGASSLDVSKHHDH